MSTPAAASAARIAVVRSRLADLGLSPDEDEVEALAAMEAMFHAALQVLRALDTDGTDRPAMMLRSSDGQTNSRHREVGEPVSKAGETP